jgi:hypothetical protein
MANAQSQSAGCTVSIGSIVAVFVSWKLNASVGWAIFHFFASWIYVIYALLFRFAEVRQWFV